MIISAKHGLRICDAFFDEPVPEADLDLARYHYWSGPIRDSRAAEYSTVLLDLRREPADLLSDMTKTGRYEIRRAAREDRTVYARHGGDPSAMGRFLKFFGAFAQVKGTAPVNLRWLSALAAHNALVLTSVCEGDGTELVWHAYVRSGAQVRLLYSASSYVHAKDTAGRAYIGRANRHHHWSDCRMFRDSGVAALDLGGVCAPCGDPALMGIREFKTSFGGTVATRFDCTRAISARAKAAMWLGNRLSQIMRLSRHSMAMSPATARTGIRA